MESVGAPHVLRMAELEARQPGKGEVLVRNRAAGVNFIDTLIRSGGLPAEAMPTMPHVLGVEGAGDVIAVGEGVRKVKPGQRGLWLGLPGVGGYGPYSTLDARYVAPFDSKVSYESAAAAPVIYSTARHMLESFSRFEPGDWIIVRSASGGVGAALLQCARRKGLRAIGLSSASKHEFALSQGAVEAIDYKTTDVAARVREITGGAGVKAVLSPVGGPTLAQDLAMLAPFGQVIVFGFMQGPPTGGFADVLVPHYNKSVGVRLSDLFTLYLNKPERMEALLAEVALELAGGAISPPITKVFACTEAARAHELLESGDSFGKLVLKHDE